MPDTYAGSLYGKVDAARFEINAERTRLFRSGLYMVRSRLSRGRRRGLGQPTASLSVPLPGHSDLLMPAVLLRMTQGAAVRTPRVNLRLSVVRESLPRLTPFASTWTRGSPTRAACHQMRAEMTSVRAWHTVAFKPLMVWGGGSRLTSSSHETSLNEEK